MLVIVKIILCKNEIFLFYKYNNSMEISALMMIMNTLLYVPNFAVFIFIFVKYFFNTIIEAFSIFQVFNSTPLPSTYAVWKNIFLVILRWFLNYKTTVSFWFDLIFMAHHITIKFFINYQRNNVSGINSFSQINNVM